MSSSDRVVVAGGGIVGLACAHYLQQAGMHVTVVEQGKIGGACSHANCGYVCPSHVPPLTEPGAFGVALKSLFNPKSPFRVKPSFNPAVWNWMWQFARRCHHSQVLKAGESLQSILDFSMEAFRNLIKIEDFDCEWKEDGLLYVFQTQSAMEAFAKTDQMLTENFGVSATRLEGDRLPEFDSGLREGLAGAFHYPGDTSIRPDRLNSQWSGRLRDNGVKFLESCALLSVEKSGGRIVSIETSNGSLPVDKIVFAMGAWSPHWAKQLECKIPILPGKGYSVTLSRPELSPSHPILFPEHKVGVSPFDSGFRLGSMMEFVGYDESIPAERIQQLRDSARPYLKADVDGPEESTWFGWRPMTWDSLPIIDRTPRIENAFLATGHNMLGLSLAPGTGRLVAELVQGIEPSIDVSPFCVSRF